MRADGILYPGDVIISINDVIVEDQVQFYDVINKAFISNGKNRSGKKIMEDTVNRYKSSSNWTCCKKASSYFIAYLHRIDGMKLGLSVRQIHDQVVVTKCKDGSIVSKCYQEGDHILDVDGVR
uniref:PDZ domain-containing protein n=1 Tax=Loa loa TaxID=7209 RepID=A0A1I7W2M8_LOALO